ncbi:hypothetical protein NQ318_013550 [Aromia moschata]|uniref:Uncharacterized protein n=1 Tax=Aromia moschata TaxID=1265417 RepID=A0AAV8XZ47_9CUCU|nr:hypothetical protein NQ318_013550 [Aromia moschata]
MCAKMAFQHQAGTAMECLSIPITLHKEGIYVTEVHDSSPASRAGLRCMIRYYSVMDMISLWLPIKSSELHKEAPSFKFAGGQESDNIHIN